MLMFNKQVKLINTLYSVKQINNKMLMLNKQIKLINTPYSVR